jgi:hypothetical protein
LFRQRGSQHGRTLLIGADGIHHGGQVLGRVQGGARCQPDQLLRGAYAGAHEPWNTETLLVTSKFRTSP